MILLKRFKETRKKSDYDSYGTCIICFNDNDYQIVDTLDSIICEVKTTCKECGHEDYWAYGHYQSQCEDYEFEEEFPF